MTKNIVAKANLGNPLILWNGTQQRANEQSSKIGYSLVAATVKEAITNADIIEYLMHNSINMCALEDRRSRQAVGRVTSYVWSNDDIESFLVIQISNQA